MTRAEKCLLVLCAVFAAAGVTIAMCARSITAALRLPPKETR